MATDHPLRQLPAVNRLLAELPASVPLPTRTMAVRAVLETVRAEVRAGAAVPTLAELVRRVEDHLRTSQQPTLRLVINATGIVLHTNLGRAPLAEVAAQAAYQAARGYLNLELDLATGKRSARQNAIRGPLTALTNAAAATAVNNCAAATILVLRTLAAGREVIVSRGQLVEIGGSFRIPDILSVSGARLREVGTTNITRLSDYAQALTPDTGLLLRVHPSNFRVRGFTHTVPLADLVALGRQRGVPVVDDLGSGALIDFAAHGLPGEPCVRSSIAAGADVVLFSGDKLLGGPQAGIIVGRADLLARMERDPLMRALRLDKMTLAALEATLRLYADPTTVPVVRLLTTPVAELRARCQVVAAQLQTLSDRAVVKVARATGYVGGGSLPDQRLPSVVVAVQPTQVSAGTLAQRLRTGTPAVVARVRKGHVLFDLRTVLAEQTAELVRTITQALA